MILHCQMTTVQLQQERKLTKRSYSLYLFTFYYILSDYLGNHVQFATNLFIYKQIEAFCNWSYRKLILINHNNFPSYLMIIEMIIALQILEWCICYWWILCMVLNIILVFWDSMQNIDDYAYSKLLYNFAYK